MHEIENVSPVVKTYAALLVILPFSFLFIWDGPAVKVIFHWLCLSKNYRENIFPKSCSHSEKKQKTNKQTNKQTKKTQPRSKNIGLYSFTFRYFAWELGPLFSGISLHILFQVEDDDFKKLVTKKIDWPNPRAIMIIRFTGCNSDFQRTATNGISTFAFSEFSRNHFFMTIKH